MSEVVAQIIGALRETYPGIVEEWERQRAEVAEDGEDWPAFETPSDLAWWLDSEIIQTNEFMPYDETGTERALQQFCWDALKYLREDGGGATEYARLACPLK